MQMSLAQLNGKSRRCAGSALTKMEVNSELSLVKGRVVVEPVVSDTLREAL